MPQYVVQIDWEKTSLVNKIASAFFMVTAEVEDQDTEEYTIDLPDDTQAIHHAYDSGAKLKRTWSISQVRITDTRITCEGRVVRHKIEH